MISTVTISGKVIDGAGVGLIGDVAIELVDADGDPVTGSTDDGGVAQKLAGELLVDLAGDGTLTVALTPNSLISPSGTQYRVVYELSDAAETRYQRRQETWSVPDLAGPLGFDDVLV